MHVFTDYIVFIIDLTGKSLAEKSSLMGKTWREMSKSEKEKYQPLDDGNDEEEITDLPPAKRKKLFLRVARRHQGDVCESTA